MSDHSEIIKLAQRSEFHDELIKEIRSEMAMISKDVTSQAVKGNEIERRLVQHSERHENNYKELKDEFRREFHDIKEDFSVFKGAVLKRLDSNSGRDAVIKFLLGAAVTAIIGGIVTYRMFGGV